jgi:hypothetical protein
MRWAAHREQMRGSKKREAAARKLRSEQLKATSAKCHKRKRKRIVMCKADRDRIRQIARDAIEREKAFRKDAREAYAEDVGKRRRLGRGKKRYSKAESDSLAIHSIPDHLVSLFQELAHNFPVSLQPDHRAELFMEWVEAHPEAVAQAQAETLPTDAELAAAELAAHEAQAGPNLAKREQMWDAHDKATKLQKTAERAWRRWEKGTWPRDKDRTWARERAELADAKAAAAWQQVEQLDEAVPF